MHSRRILGLEQRLLHLDQKEARGAQNLAAIQYDREATQAELAALRGIQSRNDNLFREAPELGRVADALAERRRKLREDMQLTPGARQEQWEKKREVEVVVGPGITPVTESISSESVIVESVPVELSIGPIVDPSSIPEVESVVDESVVAIEVEVEPVAEPVAAAVVLEPVVELPIEPPVILEVVPVAEPVADPPAAPSVISEVEPAILESTNPATASVATITPVTDESSTDLSPADSATNSVANASESVLVESPTEPTPADPTIEPTPESLPTTTPATPTNLNSE